MPAERASSGYSGWLPPVRTGGTTGGTCSMTIEESAGVSFLGGAGFLGSGFLGSGFFGSGFLGSALGGGVLASGRGLGPGTGTTTFSGSRLSPRTDCASAPESRGRVATWGEGVRSGRRLAST